MSVINQVLLELEKRHASGPERGILPDHVRALPDSAGVRGVPWLAVGTILAVLAVTVAAWLALFGPGREPRASAAPVASPATDPVVEKMVSTSATAARGVPPPAARLSLELANPLRPEQAGELEPRPARTREPIPAARVVAQSDGAEPAPAVPAKAAAASNPAPAEAAAPAVRVAKEPAHPATAPVAEKAALTGKPGIEKQVRQASARELADNEYRKAAGSLHQGRAHEALEGFRAAVNLYPGHHAARQALVALLLESKANTEAERVLQEGLKLAPEQIGFAMTLARMQVDSGDGSGAIATLQGSLPHAQGSPDYSAFLAALLQRQGQHGQAIEQFQAALKARPATGVWWLGLAISLQAVSRAPEAQEAYRRAKTTNNLNPELTALADQRLRQLQ